MRKPRRSASFTSTLPKNSNLVSPIPIVPRRAVSLSTPEQGGLPQEGAPSLHDLSRSAFSPVESSAPPPMRAVRPTPESVSPFVAQMNLSSRTPKAVQYQSFTITASEDGDFLPTPLHSRDDDDLADFTPAPLARLDRKSFRRMDKKPDGGVGSPVYVEPKSSGNASWTQLPPRSPTTRLSTRGNLRHRKSDGMLDRPSHLERQVRPGIHPRPIKEEILHELTPRGPTKPLSARRDARPRKSDGMIPCPPDLERQIRDPRYRKSEGMICSPPELRQQIRNETLPDFPPPIPRKRLSGQKDPRDPRYRKTNGVVGCPPSLERQITAGILSEFQPRNPTQRLTPQKESIDQLQKVMSNAQDPAESSSRLPPPVPRSTLARLNDSDPIKGNGVALPGKPLFFPRADKRRLKSQRFRSAPTPGSGSITPTTDSSDNTTGTSSPPWRGIEPIQAYPIMENTASQNSTSPLRRIKPVRPESSSTLMEEGDQVRPLRRIKSFLPSTQATSTAKNERWTTSTRGRSVLSGQSKSQTEMEEDDVTTQVPLMRKVSWSILDPLRSLSWKKKSNANTKKDGLDTTHRWSHQSCPDLTN